MFTPKANSKQKRAKNANVFQIGLTENPGPILGFTAVQKSV